jgi:hypothetical protein
MEVDAMKTINLCPTCSCCPRLVVERVNGELKLTLVDDDGTKITLDSEIARNLALAIFKEIGTSV